MQVSNFISPRSCRPVANQFIIKDDNGNVFFQSYKSIIAKKDCNGKITLDSYFWDYSATTGKYRNEFLGMGIAETREMIKRGAITLENLN